MTIYEIIQKVKIIVLPKDVCPLDAIADLGEQAVGSQIFLSKAEATKIRNSAETTEELIEDVVLLKWNATETVVETSAYLFGKKEENWQEMWAIKAVDIAFKVRKKKPDKIYAFIMEGEEIIA